METKAQVTFIVALLIAGLAFMASCTTWALDNNEQWTKQVTACVSSGGQWVPNPSDSAYYQCIRR